ncbi:MAG: Dabb family protein [Clostridia bacterium]|nr:Dabb family protein [Clostridia bacterium]
MIRHIVMFKFKEENKAENVAHTKAMLDALPAKIPQILSSQTYTDCAVKADNFDLILISDFASHEDLEAYIVHPDHKAVGAFMTPVRESRACVDIEL